MGAGKNMAGKVYRGEDAVVYAVGDLHGDYGHFRKIVETFETAENNGVLLFLGDYADRGPRGLEIITDLHKLLDSRRDIIALKGNHEMYRNERPTFSPCDLIYEAEEKYGSWKKFWDEVMSSFIARLYQAAVINKVLFVHGGISSVIRHVEDLGKPENERVLLWSDPSEEPGEQRSMRGAGCIFGEDVSIKVLSSLGLEMIVRSHEPRKAVYGPYAQHGGRVITTNASAYYGRPFVLRVDTASVRYSPIFA